MAEELTLQQRTAVHDRGGKLLVSAAAGSGKTKVLVDRLLSYISNPDVCANVDDFLIITYTKAAAGELRAKIGAKLAEKIAEDPSNVHLQRQLQRLYLAKISTVHSFCAELLREYAYKLDIPADFRVAEESECLQLQLQVIDSILNEAYANTFKDDDFRAFVDSQGFGRDDRNVPGIIVQIYNSAKCHLSFNAWLEQCVENAEVQNVSDVSETPWGAYLMEDLKNYLRHYADALRKCAEAAAISPGMEKPSQLLYTTVDQLERLARYDTWDEIVRNKQIDYGVLRFGKNCVNTDLIEQIKVIRESCKTGVSARLRSFSDYSEQVLSSLRTCASATKGLICLVRRFDEVFAKAKKQRRILDFSDLEHMTLDLLLGKNRSQITSVADEIGARFTEIMVDEYQDSNAVQDAIFNALTHKQQNCFMVGDVKQSIYQFRLADPGIFLDKYNRYEPAASAEPMQGRKVLLSTNFRSSGGVIEAVNHVFENCMTKAVGGLDYGADERLSEGVEHIPLHEPEVCFTVIPVQEDKYVEEAEYTAQKISQLLDGTHMIREKDTLRPVKPEDIVILLRSPRSVGPDFCNALEKRGIRCNMGAGTDLMHTEEISLLRSFLQIIHNPLQDIALLAVLMSRVVGFTADEVAALRSKDRKSRVFEVLSASEDEKVKSFLTMLSSLRKDSRLLNVPRLLDRVLAVTRLDSIFAAMPDGTLRSANIQQLLRTATDFENTVHGDLSRFLEYLDVLEEKGVSASEGTGTSGNVTLMSIHKSKGLEFPVVFLCGLSRGFNRDNLNEQVLCDRQLGLGLSCVDRNHRIRFPSVAKKAISVKALSDSISEEMRVLYVAMTRARDRLFMTFATKNPEKLIGNLVNRMDICHKQLLTSEVDCPGMWVLLGALKRVEAGKLFALGGRPAQLDVKEPFWDICVENASLEITEPIFRLPDVDLVDGKTIEHLRKSLSFQYPNNKATVTPSKLTATQLKDRYKDTEIAQDARRQNKHHVPREASFAATRVRPSEFGTVTHKVMQYIHFDACRSSGGVCDEVKRLVREGFLSEEQGKIVNCQMIENFFASRIGRQFLSGENVLREFKFSLLVDASEYYDAIESEEILLQGVLDCALLEEDGITVVDFKTDYVTQNNLTEINAMYIPQVKAYAKAVSRIFHKQIKGAYLYYFRLNQFVQVL